jgi:hypothetical protein
MNGDNPLNNRRTIIFLAAAGLVAFAAYDSVAATQVKLNGALVGEVSAVGRNASGNNVTASMKLTNTGNSVIYLMLAGDDPVAFDSAGTKINFRQVGGLTKCNLSSSAHLGDCMGITQGNQPNAVPLQTYTEVDPGASITVQFHFDTSTPSRAPLISMAANLVYRVVANPQADDALTDSQKRQQLRVMNLSFQDVPVTEGR